MEVLYEPAEQVHGVRHRDWSWCRRRHRRVDGQHGRRHSNRYRRRNRRCCGYGPESWGWLVGAFPALTPNPYCKTSYREVSSSFQISPPHNSICNSKMVLCSVNCSPPTCTVARTGFELWLGGLWSHLGRQISGGARRRPPDWECTGPFCSESSWRPTGLASMRSVAWRISKAMTKPWFSDKCAIALPSSPCEACACVSLRGFALHRTCFSR